MLCAAESEAMAGVDSRNQRLSSPAQAPVASAGKPESKDEGRSLLSPSLKGFASIFSRRPDPPATNDDSSAARPADPPAVPLAEKSNGMAGDGVELVASGRGRHGRVPSLNAWNEPPYSGPGDDSAAADRVGQRGNEPLETHASDFPNGKSASFHFSRLPEPQDSTLPVWRSRSPSPR